MGLGGVTCEQVTGEEERVGHWRAGKKEQAPLQLNKPSPPESLSHLGCLAQAWDCEP